MIKYIAEALFDKSEMTFLHLIVKAGNELKMVNHSLLLE